MSVKYYDDTTLTKLNSETSLKEVRWMEECYTWVVRSLVQDTKEVKLEAVLNDKIIQNIHTDSFIVFYAIAADSLEIKAVIDLHTLNKLDLTKKQELTYFKLCCEMQDPPRKDLDLDIEILEAPRRKKLYFRAYDDINTLGYKGNKKS